MLTLSRFFGCGLLATLGLLGWLAPASAFADTTNTSQAEPVKPNQRPASPLETEGADFADRVEKEQTAFEQRDAKRQTRLLMLSAGGTWLERASEEPARASYLSGPGVEFAGTVLLTNWLGVRLSGAYDQHAVHLHSLGNGVTLTGSESANLAGLTLAASVEPRWEMSERFSVLAGFGLAWDRFALSDMVLETDQGTAHTRQRTGVLLEFPITVGFTFSPIPQRFGIALRARYAPRTRQTGDLFDGGLGAGQLVSESSGDMLFIPGLPRFAPALSIGLHCELSL